MEKGPFEYVCPIGNSDVPASYVSLPECNLWGCIWFSCSVFLGNFTTCLGREDAMQEKLSEALSRASRCLGNRFGPRFFGCRCVSKNKQKTRVFDGVCLLFLG